ncbi:hypothetical protein LTR10_014181 [Elasticomyces elasticus]|uniref:Uncharacterized protein n=1 Tax=Exophiala sideris TaxID=1016849 RepID=A0ABR0J3S4_9EURO|nr:hypothetical protein LTR10_014181 [Elasticomyces elasticus]KAK5026590.1 hypothetical protein LTS07_007524 [Exophiala sideris]KAK5033670.1 hypothetical protein LTR13_006722 [Exophiala sideris]KAK5055493.1 hypothetical protein LTR69_008326 [Exophiala sideris]KAK5180125.1 hypothetical protein LTR44_007601 [Eurotiomycetes sp. CCFEE 6388]
MSSTVPPAQTYVDAPSDYPGTTQDSDPVMESAAPTGPIPAQVSVPAPPTEDVVMSTSPTTAATVPSVTNGTVPLDSPLRTTPIHPSLSSIKVSEGAGPNTNPLTLQRFTETELAQHGYAQLRTQLTPADKEELAQLRAETAALLKQKLDERENKMRDTQRDIDEKEKIREVERKVFRKKLDAMKGK